MASAIDIDAVDAVTADGTVAVFCAATGSAAMLAHMAMTSRDRAPTGARGKRDIFGSPESKNDQVGTDEENGWNV